MTDDERDALLKRLDAGQEDCHAGLDEIEVYIKAMAGKILGPDEIADIETGLALRASSQRAANGMN